MVSNSKQRHYNNTLSSRDRPDVNNVREREREREREGGGLLQKTVSVSLDLTAGSLLARRSFHKKLTEIPNDLTETDYGTCTEVNPPLRSQ